MSTFSVTAFGVRLPGFEGTVEELLHAAQRGEVDLAEVRLEEVVTDFERSWRAQEAPDPAALAEFLVLASRLVQLKAGRLLPDASQDDAAQPEDEGPALEEELARRQQLYLLYRQAAERLMAWHEAEQLSFPGMPLDQEELELDLASLVQAFQRVLRRLPEIPEMTVVQPAYTVEEKVSEIEAALHAAGGALGFSALLERARDRMEAVALFLALLELLKRRILRVRQPSAAADIEVRLR